MSKSVLKRLINNERKCKKRLPCLEVPEQIHPNLNNDNDKKIEHMVLMNGKKFISNVL